MKPNDEYIKSENIQIGKIVAWAIVGVIFIVFASMSGCTAYINSERQILASTELEKARNQVDIDKNNAIMDLIKNGTNPIAARCAIYGSEKSDLCGAFISNSKETLQ